MPKHIRYFEILFLSAIGLGVISAALMYQDVDARARSQGLGGAFVLSVNALTLAVSLSLVLFTSRKRSNVAKWALIVVFAIGLVFYVPQLARAFALGAVGIVAAIAFLLQCIGIYLLFTEESRAWFRSGAREAVHAAARWRAAAPYFVASAIAVGIFGVCLALIFSHAETDGHATKQLIASPPPTVAEDSIVTVNFSGFELDKYPNLAAVINNISLSSETVETANEGGGMGSQPYLRVEVLNRNDFAIAGITMGVLNIPRKPCSWVEQDYSDIYQCSAIVPAKTSGSVLCAIPNIEKRRERNCLLGFLVTARNSEMLSIIKKLGLIK